MVDDITLMTLDYGIFWYIPYCGQCRIYIINRMKSPLKSPKVVPVTLFRV